MSKYWNSLNSTLFTICVKRENRKIRIISHHKCSLVKLYKAHLKVTLKLWTFNARRCYYLFTYLIYIAIQCCTNGHHSISLYFIFKMKALNCHLKTKKRKVINDKFSFYMLTLFLKKGLDLLNFV